MGAADDQRRLLLVHAHPDDESIETGATMAAYAAQGASVTLVTCTLGELGEVIPPGLAQLTGDRLGQYRIGELAEACAALGVTDHRFLGGPGRWRDSGMMGLPGNDDPGCFWQADVATAAAALAAVIREVRPQVLVTYDANGYYGHPDHNQAHRVSQRAVRLAAGGDGRDRPPWRVGKFYATAMPRSVLAGLIELGPGRPERFRQARSVSDLPFGVADEQVTTEIDGTAWLAAKTAALRAHATQIAVDGGCYALSDGVGQRITGREYYTLLAGPRGAGAGRGGWEDDLFAGL
ncbi:MAG TPA: N-acetyl-1-D-myo-inositol-2-amino-2-deoxy-alpha-D-glucopyranoside deacetylase [Streptosporangiaceae bacterium]|nr:N-acetyl-1-D-myo-inositol-2-amino-2-deoxy-alpha-D-glucopyranoside deacetylase [Streptosporangiaceae bacterium]